MPAEIVVIVASIAFGMMILIARPRVGSFLRPEFGRSIAASLRDLARPWSVVTILSVLACAVLCLHRDAVRSGLPQLLLIVGAAAAFLVAWFRELLLLMSLRDDELPGRFDKPIWAFLLIALPPLGLVAFRCHRATAARAQPSYQARPEPKPAADYARELA